MHVPNVRLQYSRTLRRLQFLCYGVGRSRQIDAPIKIARCRDVEYGTADPWVIHRPQVSLVLFELHLNERSERILVACEDFISRIKHAGKGDRSDAVHALRRLCQVFLKLTDGITNIRVDTLFPCWPFAGDKKGRIVPDELQIRLPNCDIRTSERPFGPER